MIRRSPAALVILAILAYAVFVGFLCTLKYCYYLYDDFDLAVHVQSAANIMRGTGDCSLLGIPFLGNHMVLILYLLAPLQAMFPSALTLLCIQTLVLASGAWGIYLLGRSEISKNWGAFLALVYLLHPALLRMNLFEFHPVALTTSLLIFAFYGYQQNRPVLFWVMAILSMACQENIAMIIACFSLLACVDRRSFAWRICPAIVGALVFLVTVGWVMPALNNHSIQFDRLYAHLGNSPSEMLINMVHHPIRLAAILFAPEKVRFLVMLFLPTAFIGLACPRALIPMLPVLAQRLLSARASEASIDYHYQAELLPFIFVAAVLGLKRALGWRMRSPAIVVAVMIAAPLVSSMAAQNWSLFVAPIMRANEDNRQLYESLLARIPPENSVAASFRFLPQLALRKNVYSLHNLYTGTYTLSTKPFPVPKDLDYVVLDESDRLFTDSGFAGPGNTSRLASLLSSEGWRVEDNVNGCRLMRKAN